MTSRPLTNVTATTQCSFGPDGEMVIDKLFLHDGTRQLEFVKAESWIRFRDESEARKLAEQHLEHAESQIRALANYAAHLLQTGNHVPDATLERQGLREIIRRCEKVSSRPAPPPQAGLADQEKSDLNDECNALDSEANQLASKLAAAQSRIEELEADERAILEVLPEDLDGDAPQGVIIAEYIKDLRESSDENARLRRRFEEMDGALANVRSARDAATEELELLRRGCTVTKTLGNASITTTPPLETERELKDFATLLEEAAAEGRTLNVPQVIARIRDHHCPVLSDTPEVAAEVRAAQIVDKLFDDLRDRRGLKTLFSGSPQGEICSAGCLPLDLETQAVIRTEWARAIAEVLGASGEAPRAPSADVPVPDGPAECDGTGEILTPAGRHPLRPEIVLCGDWLSQCPGCPACSPDGGSKLTKALEGAGKRILEHISGGDGQAPVPPERNIQGEPEPPGTFEATGTFEVIAVDEQKLADLMSGPPNHIALFTKKPGLIQTVSVQVEGSGEVDAEFVRAENVVSHEEFSALVVVRHIVRGRYTGGGNGDEALKCLDNLIDRLGNQVSGSPAGDEAEDSQ